MSNYVAYVGSYTYRGKSKGITLYDVDAENGRFLKRAEIAQNNVTFIAISPDQQFLYAVVDEGVSAFRILDNGDLEFINTGSIRGLRGCHAALHPSGRFMTVSGYHDGKMTILKINEDGSVGAICDEIYDKGFGSVAERNFRPHVCWSEFSLDGNFIFMVDSGIDQVRIYAFDENTAIASFKDILHCELNAGPHQILLSKDHEVAYVLNELKNYIAVYNYSPNKRGIPSFEFKQLVSTLPKKYNAASAACRMTLSLYGDHLFCTNAGENTVAFYKIDPETGMLYVQNILPISGDYPIDVEIFPDGRYLVSVNQDSNALTFFTVNYENQTIVMHGRELKCDAPTCCSIVETKA